MKAYDIEETGVAGRANADGVRKEVQLREAASFLARSPNATQAEIARAIGVSRATLHRTFAGKSVLVEALLRRAEGAVFEAMEQARLEEGSAEEALRRLVDELVGRGPYLALSYTFHKEGGEAENYALWEEADRRIVDFFERGQREGSFGPQLTAAWMSESLFALAAAGEWTVQSGRCARRDLPSLLYTLFWTGARGPGAE